jgi:hypothetical protein
MLVMGCVIAELSMSLLLFIILPVVLAGQGCVCMQLACWYGRVVGYVIAELSRRCLYYYYDLLLLLFSYLFFSCWVYMPMGSCICWSVADT